MNIPRWLLMVFAVIGGAATLTVFALRFHSVEVTGHAAPTTQTTGCEEESAFAVWRAAHGKPVYADTAKVPFASAYFNWLFYYGYGVSLRPLLASHGDASLHLYARRLTVVGAFFGSAVLIVLVLAIAREAGPDVAAVGVVLALTVFLGALPSWWALTVRPDIWALAFETAGLVWFLMIDRRSALAAAAGAALFFFAAWSCKQTFIAGGAAVGIFLLLHRRWRDGVVLAALFGLLVLLPVTAFDAAYRNALTETVAATGFSLSTGLWNTLGAGVKMSPLIVAIPAIIRALRCGRPSSSARTLCSDALQVGLIGTGLAAAIAGAASFKGGAATNYYFSLQLMLTVAAIAAIGAVRAKCTLMFVGVMLALLPIATLAGRMGVTNLDGAAAIIARRWQIWASQPEPRFSADLRLNLPWLSDASPPLVLAFNYPFDRDRGRPFEQDGVGGMIDRGYFASLLLPNYVRDSFDGGRLIRYERLDEIDGMALYRRRDTLHAAPDELGTRNTQDR